MEYINHSILVLFNSYCRKTHLEVQASASAAGVEAVCDTGGLFSEEKTLEALIDVFCF